ncbi:hypothetical protein HLH33_13830 [Gluconacetobacter diazotrophicus]|uniref:Uncharacterized protein n=1 Tax=Gluconacetobacter diazotrophicus TaxID=33996 RepID=A0A7W4NGL8_GLUDI|nr:hypothetical protein [Gluconacetobacter diazotrophicus]MBB2157379.1 hypothetical protein [Gluconacetobacter diazotrophicus]
MQNFDPRPIVIRQTPKFVVTQEGGRLVANVKTLYIGIRSEILANERHFARKSYPKMLEGMISGEVEAFIAAEIDGQRGVIVITPEQYSAGRPERDRWNEWSAALATYRASCEAAARHFDGQNENGEGYNPCRNG